MSACPPRIIRPAVGNLWFAAALLSLAAAAAGAVIFCFDPATHGFYPVCQFHQWTGLNCPGCGATRAVYALLHGRLGEAWRDNALLMLAPVAVLARLGWRRLAARPGPLVPAGAGWALLLAAAGFAVLRNLPAFAFLSPPPG